MINPRLEEFVKAMSLEGLAIPNNTPVQGANVNVTTNSSPRDYILIPAFTLGGHSYPDVEASLTRINNAQYSSLPNTGTDLNGNQFVGNINYERAILLNNELQGFTPSPILGREFLKTLRAGINGENVYFADGSKIQDKTILQKTLDDVLKVSDPWRAEWLDARFSISDDKKITYPVFDGSGNLTYCTEELDPETLMEDSQIDFDSWLRDDNITSRGLPRSNIKKGKYYYWYPRDKSVAWFVAGSVGSYFYCDGDPGGSGTSLGVRNMRLHTQKI